MSIKPWLSISRSDVTVAIDYGRDDIRLLFKDTKTIDKVIKDLEELRNTIKETESYEN